MKITIDYNAHPDYGPAYQIIKNEEDGEILSWRDIRDRIVVDSYENRNGQLVLVLTDHTYQEK